MIYVEKFDYIEDVRGYINKCTLSGQNEFVNRIDEHINNLNNCFRGLELSMAIYDKYEILFDKTHVKEVLYDLKQEIRHANEYKKKVNDAIKMKQDVFCTHHWETTSYVNGGTYICTLCGKEHC